jgi:hypothetical protein
MKVNSVYVMSDGIPVAGAQIEIKSMSSGHMLSDARSSETNRLGMAQFNSEICLNKNHYALIHLKDNSILILNHESFSEKPPKTLEVNIKNAKIPYLVLGNTDNDF